MAILKRDQIKPPVLRKETVACEALGGDVIVQALGLTLRLAMEGKKDDVPLVLAACVLAEDGAAVFDMKGWVVWGGSNASEAVRLFNKVMELSGMNLEAVAKN